MRSARRQAITTSISVGMRTRLPVAGPGRRGAVDADGDRSHRRNSLAEQRRQDLAELGQRGQGGLADDRIGAGRQVAQGDGDGDRLLVVEQQRRQPPAGAELVPAVRSGRAGHRVAEVAQPGDVAAQGALGDLQPPGQVGGAPPRPRREHGEQPQQPAGRVHVARFAHRLRT